MIDWCLSDKTSSIHWDKDTGRGWSHKEYSRGCWNIDNNCLEKVEESKTASETMMGMAEDDARIRIYPSIFADPEMFFRGSLAESLMEQYAPKRKTFMTSIVDKIKNLKLTETDRILRKHGFEDENGQMTDEAMELMDDELQQERWATRRGEIAADIKKVEAAEKK